MTAHFIPLLERGEAKRILFMATGALMSPSSIQQGEAIPAVGHLIALESAEEEQEKTV
jgi:stage V sporulation protein AD